MTISAEQKSLARYLRDLIGGKPMVFKFWDDAHHNSVDIMTIDGEPNKIQSTLSTLGLSNTDIGLTVEGKPLRIEFLMVFSSNQRVGENILATTAFDVINSKKKVFPGAVFKKNVELYSPEGDMKHVLLSSPFLWDFHTQEFETKKVTWLQVVPISDAEYDYSVTNGVAALEDLLEKHKAEITDLNRQSVI